MKRTEKDCSSIELVVTEKGRERRVIAESVEQIGRAEKRRANKAESGSAEQSRESQRGREEQSGAKRSRPEQIRADQEVRVAEL